MLHLGNSFTFDAVSYLQLILDGCQADVSDMCIYRGMRPGAHFKEWYDIYYDQDTAIEYQLTKVCGGINANIPVGVGAKGDGTLLKAALNDEQWDIIVIQPSSSWSPYYELWNEQEPSGYLDELLDIIKQHQPNALIGIMLVHSAASTYANNAEQSALKRWELIVQSVEKCCAEKDIDLVIPYGTAVQNLRASSLNNSLDLTADGLHCEYVLCRYTASCCYYETLIAPWTGISVLNDRTRINADFITSDTPMVSVTNETAPIAQKAAIMAVANWHVCANPETMETGINQVKAANSDDSFYSLSGIRMAEGHKLSKPSIGIKNGKKYLMR